MIAVFRASGVWAFRSRGLGGRDDFCFMATLRGVRPSNGTLPVSISKRMMPSE